jgi:3-hydroxybutyrate dehydrogenase
MPALLTSTSTGPALAVFLCRDEAQNINGANYTIDGGWTAE